MLQALQAQSFVASGKAGEVAAVPMPWRIWVKSTALPSTSDLLAAELALELWLLPSSEINDLDFAKRALEARRATCTMSEKRWLIGCFLRHIHSAGARI